MFLHHIGLSLYFIIDRCVKDFDIKVHTDCYEVVACTQAASKLGYNLDNLVKELSKFGIEKPILTFKRKTTLRNNLALHTVLTFNQLSFSSSPIADPCRYHSRCNSKRRILLNLRVIWCKAQVHIGVSSLGQEV